MVHFLNVILDVRVWFMIPQHPRMLDKSNFPPFRNFIEELFINDLELRLNKFVCFALKFIFPSSNLKFSFDLNY